MPFSASQLSATELIVIILLSIVAHFSLCIASVKYLNLNGINTDHRVLPLATYTALLVSSLVSVTIEDLAGNLPIHFFIFAVAVFCSLSYTDHIVQHIDFRVLLTLLLVTLVANFWFQPPLIKSSDKVWLLIIGSVFLAAIWLEVMALADLIATPIAFFIALSYGSLFAKTYFLLVMIAIAFIVLFMRNREISFLPVITVCFIASGMYSSFKIN